MIKTIKFKGQDVDVKEFCANDIEEVIRDKGELTFIDIAFNPEMVTEKMLAIGTGLAVAELRATPPSDLRPLVEAIKEVNADFFSGVRSLGKQSITS